MICARTFSFPVALPQQRPMEGKLPNRMKATKTSFLGFEWHRDFLVLCGGYAAIDVFQTPPQTGGILCVICNLSGSMWLRRDTPGNSFAATMGARLGKRSRGDLQRRTPEARDLLRDAQGPGQPFSYFFHFFQGFDFDCITFYFSSLF